MYEIPSTTVSDLPDPLPDATSVLDVREPVEWAGAGREMVAENGHSAHVV